METFEVASGIKVQVTMDAPKLIKVETDVMPSGVYVEVKEEHEIKVPMDVLQSVKVETGVTPTGVDVEEGSIVKEEHEIEEVTAEVVEECPSSEVYLNGAESALLTTEKEVTCTSQEHLQMKKRKKAKEVSNGALFCCTTCSKTFSCNYELQRHKLQMHLQNYPIDCYKNCKPNQCNKCGKTFSQRRYLKWHIRTHSPNKPFHCTTCWRSFSQIASLNVHQQCHSNGETYSCFKCHKVFENQSSLKVHMEIHPDVGSFSCSTCGKTYNTQFRLTKHILTHLDVRTYMCPICGERFYFQKYVMKHLKSSTCIEKMTVKDPNIVEPIKGLWEVNVKSGKNASAAIRKYNLSL